MDVKITMAMERDHLAGGHSRPPQVHLELQWKLPMKALGGQPFLAGRLFRWV
jgi:hypothetical protein